MGRGGGKVFHVYLEMLAIKKKKKALTKHHTIGKTKEQGKTTPCHSVSTYFQIYIFLIKRRRESVHGNSANSIYERLQSALGPEGYEYFGNEIFFLLQIHDISNAL